MKKEHVQLTSVLFVVVLVCASGFALITFLPQNQGYSYTLNTFTSYDDLLAFLQERYETSMSQGTMYRDFGLKWENSAPGVAMDAGEALGSGGAPSYSTTNVQVIGVDEPDIVKTDGTYLYVLANQTIYILKAYPVFDATILATISVQNVYISDLFIRGDRLVLFGEEYESYDPEKGDVGIYGNYWWGGSSQTVIRVYDITDKTTPVLSKEVKIDGSYFDARLIDEYVYLVATEYTYNIYRMIDEQNYTLEIPTIRIDNDTQNISADKIYYVDVPELSDTMSHVLSINLDTNEVDEKSFMLGSSQTMYVSRDNIYLASAHYPVYALYMTQQGVPSTGIDETTILHKISINSGDITYIAQGEVPGHILNQFSMDEHNGFFRIATTVGNNWGEGSQTSNNVYILDADLKQISQIENIAPGESIYAARFLGDRAYLVTFVQVDPLFTLDLSDPYNPRILGELKIPGYSEYLHPYDETHIIGVGKEVDPSIDADKIHTTHAVYYTAILGVKLALFDVSDIEHPVEVAKVVIGDRGTDSPVLYDHKAFLFDREKELLVIPISLYEIPQATIDTINESNIIEIPQDWGQFTFQGAYVYHLSLENGFDYHGRITHQTPEQVQQQGQDYYWYWGSSDTDITRSLYIGDNLYTISNAMVKINALTDLSELTSISFA
ncbi:MAG: beta-propeller domain-containing protein [Candidatus Thermoplasmatota archaeon]|nr:beta-propeller domain-containing protein [Candidatus Thermoplasmatota archaeon]